MRRLLCLIIAAGSTGLAGRAAGAPAELTPNLREECRRIVAGSYLVVYDEKERLAASIRQLAAQIETVQKAREEARRDLARAAQRSREQGFELSLAAERDAAEIRVRTLGAQVDDFRAMQRDAALRLAKRTEDERQLRVTTQKVFYFMRLAEPAGGGYPFKIDFRTPCPPYRYLCPLPPRQADELLKVQIDGETPEACVHYAALSRIH
jgi:hypothetical protein